MAAAAVPLRRKPSHGPLPSPMGRASSVWSVAQSSCVCCDDDCESEIPHWVRNPLRGEPVQAHQFTNFVECRDALKRVWSASTFFCLQCLPTEQHVLLIRSKVKKKKDFLKRVLVEDVLPSIQALGSKTVAWVGAWHGDSAHFVSFGYLSLKRLQWVASKKTVVTRSLFRPGCRHVRKVPIDPEPTTVEAVLPTPAASPSPPPLLRLASSTPAPMANVAPITISLASLARDVGVAQRLASPPRRGDTLEATMAALTLHVSDAVVRVSIRGPGSWMAPIDFTRGERAVPDPWMETKRANPVYDPFRADELDLPRPGIAAPTIGWLVRYRMLMLASFHTSAHHKPVVERMSSDTDRRSFLWLWICVVAKGEFTVYERWLCYERHVLETWFARNQGVLDTCRTWWHDARRRLVTERVSDPGSVLARVTEGPTWVTRLVSSGAVYAQATWDAAWMTRDPEAWYRVGDRMVCTVETLTAHLPRWFASWWRASWPKAQAWLRAHPTFATQLAIPILCTAVPYQWTTVFTPRPFPWRRIARRSRGPSRRRPDSKLTDPAMPVPLPLVHVKPRSKTVLTDVPIRCPCNSRKHTLDTFLRKTATSEKPKATVLSLVGGPYGGKYAITRDQWLCCVWASMQYPVKCNNLSEWKTVQCPFAIDLDFQVVDDDQTGAWLDLFQGTPSVLGVLHRSVSQWIQSDAPCSIVVASATGVAVKPSGTSRKSSYTLTWPTLVCGRAVQTVVATCAELALHETFGTAVLKTMHIKETSWSSVIDKQPYSRGGANRVLYSDRRHRRVVKLCEACEASTSKQTTTTTTPAAASATWTIPSARTLEAGGDVASSASGPVKKRSKKRPSPIHRKGKCPTHQCKTRLVAQNRPHLPFAWVDVIEGTLRVRDEVPWSVFVRGASVRWEGGWSEQASTPCAVDTDGMLVYIRKWKPSYTPRPQGQNVEGDPSSESFVSGEERALITEALVPWFGPRAAIRECKRGMFRGTPLIKGATDSGSAWCVFQYDPDLPDDQQKIHDSNRMHFMLTRRYIKLSCFDEECQQGGEEDRDTAYRWQRHPMPVVLRERLFD